MKRTLPHRLVPRPMFRQPQRTAANNCRAVQAAVPLTHPDCAHDAIR